MLSNIKSSYDKVINSSEFEKNGYLCSVFVMSSLEQLEASDWQFDFYDKKTDKISSYVAKDVIEKVNVEADIFKEEKTVLEELNLDDVKFPFEDAFDKAKKHLKLKHESANKVIIVLQKDLWNITFLTNTFNMLTLKINSKNGKVNDEQFASLLNFKVDQGE